MRCRGRAGHGVRRPPSTGPPPHTSAFRLRTESSVAGARLFRDFPYRFLRLYLWISFPFTVEGVSCRAVSFARLCRPLKLISSTRNALETSSRLLHRISCVCFGIHPLFMAPLFHGPVFVILHRVHCPPRAVKITAELPNLLIIFHRFSDQLLQQGMSF